MSYEAEISATVRAFAGVTIAELRQEWRKVKVPGHADAVLEAAKAL